MGTPPRHCRPNPGQRRNKPKRDPFKIDNGHIYLPMLALAVQVPRQRDIPPKRRADVLFAGLVAAIPDWPFAWALHGILLGSMSSADNLQEARERGAATGVMKS
ncbi:MAG: hypothetical protein HOQ25_14035 [Mesorhizobium sp.]|nr:hypothetical protein [Mesorhizobium sp.]